MGIALRDDHREHREGFEPRDYGPEDATPLLDELIKTALENRPDVISYRLGVHRAEADVRLARANAISDVNVLWQLHTFQDNSTYGLKSATSWARGVTVPCRSRP